VLGGLLGLLAAGFSIYLLIAIIMFILGLFGVKSGRGGREVIALKPPERGTTTPGETPKRSPELEDELDLIMSKLHTARDNLKELKEALAKLAATTKSWADAYKGKPIDERARNLAAGIAKAIETHVLPHYEKARDDLMDAITQARTVISSSEFSEEAKKIVEKIRHETEASHQHLIADVKEKRIDKCVEVLTRFAEGRGSRTPESISKFVATQVNAAIKVIDSIRDHLAAIWKEVRDLSDAIKNPKPPKKSRGIAVPR
jgi:DNA anti-recombination protein RmuC